MTDIWKEFEDAAGGMTANHRARLDALGVPAKIHSGITAYAGWSRIETTPDGFYQPCPHGRWAVLIPCGWTDYLGQWTAIDDLVGFHPDDPSRWWRRLGAVDLLGEEQVQDALDRRQPLRLHATPLDWLRNGCQGAVVLDWRAEPRRLFNGLPSVIADTPDLAERLGQRIAQAPFSITSSAPGERYAA